MYRGKYSNPAVDDTPKKKRGQAGTIVFYVLYFLFVAAFIAGIFIATNALRQWLVRFEASQPAHKCEEVFEELFADPDWEQIYTLSGTEDTVFEGKAAYARYMTALVGDRKLTYLETSAGLSGGKKYIVRLGDEKVATFTLRSDEVSQTEIPKWELGNVEIFFTRRHSVTVEKLPEHTVYINGVPLDHSYTIRTLETAAESYLPEGIHGYRLEQQHITNLLAEPEVIVKDAEGNDIPLTKDPETGIYRLPVATMEATDGEKQLALNAIHAYAKYMIRANGIDAVKACFDTNSEIYDVIRKYEAWTMQSYASYSFTDPEFSDFYRYSDDLFSIRVKLQLNVKRTNGSVKPYDLNSTLFLQKQEDGKWLAIDMTNADTQKIIERVYLAFYDGETLLSGTMIESDAPSLTLPEVTAPEGMILEGWVVQEDDGNGKITLTVVFHPTESGIINLPVGGKLEPMILYAHFKEAAE
jgi:hypothetical protein